MKLYLAPRTKEAPPALTGGLGAPSVVKAETPKAPGVGDKPKAPKTPEAPKAAATPGDGGAAKAATDAGSEPAAPSTPKVGGGQPKRYVPKDSVKEAPPGTVDTTDSSYVVDPAAAGAAGAVSQGAPQQQGANQRTTGGSGTNYALNPNAPTNRVKGTSKQAAAQNSKPGDAPAEEKAGKTPDFKRLAARAYSMGSTVGSASHSVSGTAGLTIDTVGKYGTKGVGAVANKLMAPPKKEEEAPKQGAAKYARNKFGTKTNQASPNPKSKNKVGTRAAAVAAGPNTRTAPSTQAQQSSGTQAQQSSSPSNKAGTTSKKDAKQNKVKKDNRKGRRGDKKYRPAKDAPTNSPSTPEDVTDDVEDVPDVEEVGEDDVEEVKDTSKEDDLDIDIEEEPVEEAPAKPTETPAAEPTQKPKKPKRRRGEPPQKQKKPPRSKKAKAKERERKAAEGLTQKAMYLYIDLTKAVSQTPNVSLDSNKDPARRKMEHETSFSEPATGVSGGTPSVTKNKKEEEEEESKEEVTKSFTTYNPFAAMPTMMKALTSITTPKVTEYELSFLRDELGYDERAILNGTAVIKGIDRVRFNRYMQDTMLKSLSSIKGSR